MSNKVGIIENTGVPNALKSRSSFRIGNEFVELNSTENNGSSTINGTNDIEEEPKAKNKDQKTKENSSKPVSARELLRFADRWDILYMICGSICAALHGCSLPMFIILFGKIIDGFANDARSGGGKTTEILLSNSTFSPVADRPDIQELMRSLALDFFYIAIGVIVAGYGQVTFWVLAGERQGHRIRLAFYRSALRQNMGWYDTHSSGEISTRLVDDIDKIQKGIGDKMASLIQFSCQGIVSVLIAFLMGWKLSLVIFGLAPLLIFASHIKSIIIVKLSTNESSAYAKAGAIAEEVIGAFRTVVAFGGEKKEVQRYNSKLIDAFKAGVKRGMANGIGMGFFDFAIFCSCTLGYWYGAKLIRDDLVVCCNECLISMNMTGFQNRNCETNILTNVSNEKLAEFFQICPCDSQGYTPGKMVAVFFGILIGAFGFGQALPSLSAIASARGTARYIFDVINRIPPIDSFSTVGKTLGREVAAEIRFTNVSFFYPSRPEVPILNDISLLVRPGETVALVGSSGCGKSTTVQLMQRFYDPIKGIISLGGVDLRQLNLRWLRDQIGVVSQEPVLFATSIEENIRYGRLDVTQTEIEMAAKLANAFDFINTLPKKFQTVLGDRGTQLSGGQKQRIAIARALVRNPKILLLDEATSALDTESEKIVQDALDHARRGRTTIVIAHRLSTVQNADRIYAMSNGRVAEVGTHEELMMTKGIYYNLVQRQQMEESKKFDEFSDAETETDFKNSPEETFLRQQSVASSYVSIRSREIPEAETTEKQKNPDFGRTLKRIIQMNSKEWPYIVLGCLGALGDGAVRPAFSIVFGDLLGIFALQLDEQKRLAEIDSLIFLAIAFGAFLSIFLECYMFAISGEKLTKRLRKSTFESILRQEISWFDDSKNRTGVLITRLAADASAVKGATGESLGAVLMGVGSIGVGLTLAFIFSWKLSLVIFAFIPVVMLGGTFKMKVLSGFAMASNKEFLEAGKVAAESMDLFRTVASLGREETFYEKYSLCLQKPHERELKKSHLYGFLYGFSQSVLFFAYSASFYYGGVLVKNGELDFVAVMKVFGCILWSANAFGQAISSAPDYGKAIVSASDIFALLDQKPSIDSSSSKGKKLKKPSGHLNFNQIEFRYPTRPSVAVLRKLNLEIQPGQTVALVGSSGCGKSTCVQLLERFYDANYGTLTFDGIDVRELNLAWLRSRLGIVSQEPVLFDRTIADNIAYGDNSRQIPIAEIIDAAKAANIHQFIASLPKGYETFVGEKGGQLSGGQKQRIAIARALVRNPDVLLLDEATSALDSESEKLVQDALDRAAKSRTCLVIAHRLSTIQNADLIAVVEHGRVAESGTHSELIVAKGAYYNLVMAQKKAV